MTARRVALVLLALIAAASCSGSGTDAHSGSLSYVPADRSWRIWYLAPPWELVTPVAEPVTLRIPFSTNNMIASPTLGAIVAVTVTEVSETPDAAVQNRFAAAMAAGERMVYTARNVTFAMGVVGREAAVFDAQSATRIAAVRLASGRTAVLVFRSVEAISDDADVTAMIGEFETQMQAGP